MTLKMHKRTLWVAVSLALILALGLWWIWLALDQSRLLAEAYHQLGFNDSQIVDRIRSVHTMMMWEGGTYVGLVLILGAISLMLSYRESQKNRAMQTFFSCLSHEIKNPLAITRLQLETLALTAEKLVPNLQPQIQRLDKDMGRLSLQIDRALELSRIEHKGKLPLATLDLKRFLKWSIDSHKDGVAIDLKLPAGDSNVWANEQALDLIWRNVMDNVQKHCSAQPKKVEVVLDDHGKVTLSNPCVAGTLRPSHLGKLFYTSQPSKGTGIGLYVIRELMKRMSGKAIFEVDTRQSLFRVHLRFKLA
jgi:signal transduction histidine kinase